MFKQNVFLIRFYYIFILQGYDGILLHQRRSEAAGRRCFTKQVFLKILQNSLQNFCVGVTF